MAGRHTLPRSFAFAWSGLAEAAVRERNFRIHLALGVLAGVFAARAPLLSAERAVVIVSIALVLGAEAMNSAVEAVVDLASPRWDERARIAKDAAAGAVLAVAAGSVLALCAVALPRLDADAIRAAAPLHALPASGAAVAAAAALVLPLPSPRSAAADVLLAAAAAAGLVLASRGAGSMAGIAASAGCVLIAAAGAARRRARAARADEPEAPQERRARP